jgi:hypothetical protein
MIENESILKWKSRRFFIKKLMEHIKFCKHLSSENTHNHILENQTDGKFPSPGVGRTTGS